MRDKSSMTMLRLNAAMAAGCLIGGSFSGKNLNEPIATPPEKKQWPEYQAEQPLPLKDRKKILARKLREK